MSGHKFSLSFSKRIEKKNLQPSAIKNEGPKQQQPMLQALVAVDENTLKTSEVDLEEQQLVIPMVQGNRSAILQKAQEEAKKRNEIKGEDGEKEKSNGGKRSENKNNEDRKKVDGIGKKEEAVEENKPLTLEEQAASALIEETKQKLEQWEERSSNANLTIATGTQDSSLGTTLSEVGKEATLDDYDQIEVASFGAALLRGMGWKKSEGIGRIGKRVVEIIDPSTKAFSLASKKQGSTKEGEGQVGIQEQEEELPLVKGSFIFLHSGRHKGTYGLAETVDEDHVLVKTAVNHTIIREVELNLRVVTQQEYKESSRVINKDMYDKYKEEEGRKKEELRKKSKYLDSSDDNLKKKGSTDHGTADRYRETSEQKDRNKQESKSYDKSMKTREVSDKEIEHRLNVQHKLKSDRINEEDKYCRKGDSEIEMEITGRGEESRKKSDKNSEKHRKKDRPEYEDKKDRENLDRTRERGYSQTSEKSRRQQEWETESGDSRRDKKRSFSQINVKSGDKNDREERHFDSGENIQRKYGSKTSEKSKQTDEYDRENLWHDSGLKNSREKRKMEEERRYSDKEKIREKYEYQASSKFQGKRERKNEGYSQSCKKVERVQEWMSTVPWVRENLRVRLISKTYKGGKYHKEKVIVRCVVTAEECECEAEGGRLLKNIHPAWLETVIPKVPPQVIMIVKGDSKGQCGRILQLHKDQEKASIQLLDDETVIMKRHYDDICEYVQ